MTHLGKDTLAAFIDRMPAQYPDTTKTQATYGNIRAIAAYVEEIERDRDAALTECERMREALTDCITVFGVTQDTQFHQAYADVIARAALTKKEKEMP